MTTVLGGSRATVRGQNMSAAWRHVDWILVGLVAALSLFGSMMIYSATRNKEAAIPFIDKHIIFTTIGVAVMVAVAAIDYVKLRDFAKLLYLGGLIGLAGLFVLGKEIKGIRAWYVLGPFQIQPAELMKVLVIIAVASYLGSAIDQLGIKQLAAALAMFAVPMGLIMLQPDLGTNLVFVMIGLAMFVVAGIPLRYLAALAALAIVATVGILSSNTLESYQRDRLTSFATPDAASSAALYNTKQSQTAISLGGLTGQGYLDGEYTSGGSVPEQETDFIFTVAGEEFGFAGSAVLLALLGGVVWRIWRTAQLSRDRVGVLVCVGVLAMFVFHVFENVGMALGIMPVTGIPLPFISYGGSSTITAYIAMGLVLNVHMRRFS